jgi:hypothetical protein
MIRQLDVRLSPRTVAQIGRERAQRHDPVSFYLKYLAGLARGDVGRSELYGQSRRSTHPRTLPPLGSQCSPWAGGRLVRGAPSGNGSRCVPHQEVALVPTMGTLEFRHCLPLEN